MTETKANSIGTSVSSHKWINNLRILPTNPKVNDFLKVEYIDVNLNNSRKLISNITELTATSDKYVEDIELVHESLLPLQQVKKQLDWLP